MAVDTQTINSLLASRNISKVVYVDDSFAPSSYEPNFKAFVRASCGKEHDKWPFDDPGIEDVTIGNFVKWWGALDDSEKESQAKIFNIKRDQNEVERIVKLSFPGEVLSCLSPNSFNQQYIVNRTFIPDSNNQLLILMDYQFNNGETGLQLLRPFENNQFVSCGIFSEKFSKEEEIEKWATWCQYASHIYPISKKRSSEKNFDDFLHGLRNIIWLRQISDIKAIYIKLLESAIENVKDKFHQIDPASFDKVVMEESETEGCWEFETIHRIGETYLNKTIEDSLISNTFEEFQKQTDILRKIKIASGRKLPSSTTIAEEIISYEKYSSADYLNSTFCPVGNGDIFQVDKKYYILLCQPCNLEIRDDGQRKVGNLLYLLPIEDYNKNIRFTEQIHFKSKNRMIRYSCANLTSANIIDLVSYNKDGKAVLTIDQNPVDDNVLIRPNIKKRYGLIRKNLLSYFTKYKAISQDAVKEALGDLHSPIVESFANPESKGAVLPKPSLNDGRIDFGLQRIARLKDPYAQEYLQVFMSYLCRPANPMELK